jgi:hypothetical protein
MQVKVNVENYGTFEIDSDKVSELIGWLSANQAIAIRPKNEVVKEVINHSFTGRELIIEQDK